MRKAITWVLVADGQRARVLATNGSSKRLKEALNQDFIGNSLPSRGIGNDRPGRTYNSTNPVRHAVGEDADLHRQEKRRFVQMLVETLDQGRKRQAFERLVIVAPPQALGDLRAALTPGLKEMLVGEFPKDLTKVAVHDLPEHLEAVL